MVHENPRYLGQLLKQIDVAFNLNEIQELCFLLGIDSEHLSGDTKLSKIVSLLMYLVRRGKLEELVGVLRQMRPKFMWQTVPEDAVLKRDYVALAIRGKYRDLLDPETRFLTELIYKLSRRDGPLEYIDLKGEAHFRETELREDNTIDRKLLDPAFSVLNITGSPSPVQPKKIPLQSVRDAIEKYPHFVIIGDAGAGKSTTLRRLVLDAAWERMKNSDAPLPLLKELSRWEDDQELDDFIRDGWPLGLDLQVALISGDVTLYLDGLNEMGMRGKDKSERLKIWIHGMNRPRKAILACRAKESEALNLGITTVVIESLDEERIRAFVENYLAPKAAGFIEQVIPRSAHEKRDRRHLFYLASNPFMLRALTMLYVHLPDGALPSNKGSVFHHLLQFLWTREKDRNTVGWTSYDKMVSLLSNLAFNMMEAGCATSVPLHYAIKFVPLQILEVADSANIVAIDGSQMKFFHQSMQEYFAANYIVNSEEDSLMSRLMQHIFDDQWQEVFLFVVSLLKDTGTFFQYFENLLNEKSSNDNAIKAFFQTVERAETGIKSADRLKDKVGSILFVLLKYHEWLSEEASFRRQEYHEEASAWDDPGGAGVYFFQAIDQVNYCSRAIEHMEELQSITSWTKLSVDKEAELSPHLIPKQEIFATDVVERYLYAKLLYVQCLQFTAVPNLETVLSRLFAGD